ncbi:DNA-binding response regulator [Bacillus sp. J14TS2]|uniref:response regulator transcription factor n=1 Tax=Bacillus sp. J14TS2 TaxID=2807188 RepID=UPI001B1554E1|nr:response regulator transcription factor [Bacillus sp. J14TS2]GIN72074.1 DNA-binding response regulator [Bacillus sp. J14TS2]
MLQPKVLIVDDDDDIRRMLHMYLVKNGYDVLEAKNGEIAIALTKEEEPDILILDVTMPGMDGFEVCRIIRQKSDVPILFLSAREDDIDKIVGLSIGGDDFVTKPISPPVFIAKIKAHLRRSQQINDSKTDLRKQKLYYPGLLIDPERYTVKRNNLVVHLSAKEYKILSLLATNPNRVYTPEEIFELVWEKNSFGDHRTVMVHISNIRKKIEADPVNPVYILTVRGIGYRFNGP